MTWTSRQRISALALCWMVGVALGLLGDVARGEFQFGVRETVEALLLSPLVVAIGGSGVTPRSVAPLMFVLGLAFWPVGWWLGTRVLRETVRLWLLLATTAWVALGYFQVLHRCATLSV